MRNQLPRCFAGHATGLVEILWVSRQRLLADKKAQGIRQVQPPSEQDPADRQITALRKWLGHAREFD